MMAAARLRSFVVALVVAGSGAAHADPALGRPTQQAALDHFVQGNRLFNIAHFEEAAKEYEAGALIDPAPILDYDLGQCYRKLGRYKDAIWFFERFIKTSPQTPEHVEAAQKLIDAMRAELDKQAATAPPQEEGTAPIQPSLRAAPITLTVEPWYSDGLGWGIAGTGLLAIAVSGALFVDASSLNDDANHASTQLESNALHDKANTRSLIGTVIGIGGVGVLVTGVVKLIVHSSASASSTAWNVGVSGSGLVVCGTF
jgi:tetratricopeptide (TPR) repeat protein